MELEWRQQGKSGLTRYEFTQFNTMSIVQKRAAVGNRALLCVTCWARESDVTYCQSRAKECKIERHVKVTSATHKMYWCM